MSETHQNDCRIDLTTILKQFPDCISDKAKLHALLLDLYPTMPKGQLNALCVICESGIVAKIREQITISVLERKRWLKTLEDDYCMSGKTVELCLDTWIDAIKNLFYDTQVDEVSVNIGKRNDTKQPDTQPQVEAVDKSATHTPSTRKSVTLQENADGYVYHNQLGYGKIESSDDKWITVRFDQYRFKTERYAKTDIGRYLRIIPIEEYTQYSRTSSTRKNNAPKALSSKILPDDELDDEFGPIKQCNFSEKDFLDDDDDLANIKISDKTYNVVPNSTVGVGSNEGLDKSEWVRKYEMDDYTDYGYYDDMDYNE